MKYAACFCVVLAVYCLTRSTETQHFEHLVQALAWSGHHAYVDQYAPFLHEKVEWRGHLYELHPPLAPAVMWLASMLHFPYETGVSMLLGATAATLVYALTDSLWLTAFFAFGTDVWYETTLGDPWGFCLVLSAAVTLTTLKSRNPWLKGILAGLAALARYDLVMAWPYYLLTLPRGQRWKACPGMATAVLIYVGYAYIRFGTYHDIGLWLWWKVDAPTLGLDPSIGPFSLHYLPLGIYTALYLAPPFTTQFPWIHPSPIGQSLLTTSPALIMSLRVPLRERATQLLWLTIAMSMSGALCVWSNGVGQFGARYWIQVLPFFLCLMRETEHDQMGKLLVVASIVANAFGLWHIRTFGWAN